MKKTAIALALASAVALTACGNDEPDGTDTGMEDPTVNQWEQPEVRGPLQDTDQEDVDKVAHDVVEQIFSWSPKDDHTIADAARKAEPLMDEDFAYDNRDSWSAMFKVPGKQWASWVDDKATASVELTEGLEQRPEDTDMEARRQYSVEVTVKGDKHEQKLRYDVFAHFNHLGWWRLDNITISQPQTMS